MRESRQKIAVVGAGVSGLSAAWLLSRSHDVTLFEQEQRLGGHAHTVDVQQPDAPPLAVDTGFIVFNEATYPNFCALLAHLGVDTRRTEMSFAVSLDGGRLEYSGTSLGGLFAQRRNIVSFRFWHMLQDLLRFYRCASRDAPDLAREAVSLGDYLNTGKYGRAFRDDHLLPMAAAIWSAPCAEILSFPASAFIRFHDNHGLLRLSGRPKWRTVVGGSRRYVDRLSQSFDGELCVGMKVERIRRGPQGVDLDGPNGWSRRFDQVVLATHANEALGLLAQPTSGESELLGAFRYSNNVAVLHDDHSLMPRRRAAWSSWNHIGDRNMPNEACAVTYWMNRLQGLPGDRQFFVTLNPPRPPRDDAIIRTDTYSHPLFDAKAIAAQARLWSLQGHDRTWFCGAYFGAGFHEDGLQAGLAVAEELGGLKRPWTVDAESGRISLPHRPGMLDQAAA